MRPADEPRLYDLDAWAFHIGKFYGLLFTYSADVVGEARRQGSRSPLVRALDCLFDRLDASTSAEPPVDPTWSVRYHSRDGHLLVETPHDYFFKGALNPSPQWLESTRNYSAVPLLTGLLYHPKELPSAYREGFPLFVKNVPFTLV